MNGYMTNGTLELIQKITEDHPEIQFYLMNSGTNVLAYYEDTTKNVFAAGRAYEVLLSKGTIENKGFVVMNNITVTEDGRTAFEDRFKQRSAEVQSSAGFQAFRLLRPKSGNKYIVLTQWASIEDFENWKNSDTFKKQHQTGEGVKPPAYFADKPYITSYNMLDPD